MPFWKDKKVVLTAAKKGDWARVGQKLRLGRLAEVCDSKGMTPLLVVARDASDEVALLDLLVANGADPRARDKDGISVLLFSVQNNHPETIEWALSHQYGSLDDERDAQNRSVLYYALMSPQPIESVKSIHKAVSTSSFLRLWTAVPWDPPPHTHYQYDSARRLMDKLSAEAMEEVTLKVNEAKYDTEEGTTSEEESTSNEESTSEEESSSEEESTSSEEESTSEEEESTSEEEESSKSSSTTKDLPLVLRMSLAEDWDGLKHALDAGHDAEVSHPDTGMTPLLRVAQRLLNLDLMHLLVSKGANMRSRSKDGKSILFFAFAQGYLVSPLVIKWVLENSHVSILEERDINQRNIFHEFALAPSTVGTPPNLEESLTIIASRSLTTYLALLSMKDKYGYAPLQYGQNGANRECMIRLQVEGIAKLALNHAWQELTVALEAGQSVNTETFWEYHFTPVLRVIEGADDLEAVQFLVSKGAKLSAIRNSFSPLLLAAAHNRPKIAAWLVSKGHIDPSCLMKEATRDENKALHLAAQNGHAEMIRWILRTVGPSALSAVSEAKNRENKTPMDLALEKSGALLPEQRSLTDINPIILLALLGPPLPSKPFNLPSDHVKKLTTGWIFELARLGEWEKAKQILHYFVLSDEIEDSNGTTLLSFAAEHSDDATLMELLVSKGANPKKRRLDQSWSVLLLAVANNHLNVAKWVIDKGYASIMDEKLVNQRTALHLAAQKNLSEMVIWIFETVGSSSFLHLLEARDVDFKRPIDMALESDRHDALHCLVFYGPLVPSAPFKITTENAMATITGLLFILAFKKRWEEVKKYFSYFHPLSAEFRNANGSTLLLTAAQTDNVSLMDFLVSKGADPRSRSYKIKRSVLLMAAEHGHLNIAKWAVANGSASIMDERLSNNRTALHLAAEKNFGEIVFWIFQSVGPSSFLHLMQVKDNENKTALELAVDKRAVSAMIELICYGPSWPCFTTIKAITELKSDVEPFALELALTNQWGRFKTLVDRFHLKSIDFCDQLGMTPLLIAAKLTDDVPLMDYLVSKGANPNVRTARTKLDKITLGQFTDHKGHSDDGWTVLLLAIANDHRSVAEWALKNSKVSLEHARTSYDRSALDLVVLNDLDASWLSWLLEKIGVRPFLSLAASVKTVINMGDRKWVARKSKFLSLPLRLQVTIEACNRVVQQEDEEARRKKEAEETERKRIAEERRRKEEEEACRRREEETRRKKEEDERRRKIEAEDRRKREETKTKTQQSRPGAPRKTEQPAGDSARRIADPSSIPSNYKPSVPAPPKKKVIGYIDGPSHEAELAKNPNYDKANQPTFRGPCWLGEDVAAKRWGAYDWVKIYTFQPPVEFANKHLASDWRIPDMIITRWGHVKTFLEQNLHSAGLAFLDQSFYPGSRTIDYNQFLVSYFYRRNNRRKNLYGQEECLSVDLFQIIRTVGVGIKRELHWDRYLTRGSVKALIPGDCLNIPDLTEKSETGMSFWSFGDYGGDSSTNDSTFDSAGDPSPEIDSGPSDFTDGGGASGADFGGGLDAAASSSVASIDFSSSVATSSFAAPSFFPPPMPFVPSFSFGPTIF